MFFKRQTLWLLCFPAGPLQTSFAAIVAATTTTTTTAFITPQRREPRPTGIASFATGIVEKQQRLPSSLPINSSNSNNNDAVETFDLSAGAENASTKVTYIVCEEPSVVVQRVFATDKRPVILFDGVCNLCNGAVNLALDWDPRGKLRFAALQSNVGKALLQANGRAADDISSIVLVTQDGAYIKSDAILRITEALTPLRLLPLKPAAVLGRWAVPRFLRDLIYDGVANNRYQVLGKQDQCRFDADGEFEDRFVIDDLALKKKQQ